MINLAEQRLFLYKGRAKVVMSDGAMRFALPDHSVDRVVSTYVLDLLSETDIRALISEAHRVLMPGGKLCLVGLAVGATFTSRIVPTLWSTLFSLHAPLVGGCRPVQFDSFFDQHNWSIDYHNVVTQFCVPSGVIIASPQSVPKH